MNLKPLEQLLEALELNLLKEIWCLEQAILDQRELIRSLQKMVGDIAKKIK